MKIFRLLGIVLLLPVGAWSTGAEPNGGRTVMLWPADPRLNAPDKLGTVQRDGTKTRVTDVRTPHLKVYPAPEGDAPTPAVILIPGGGYRKLVPSVHWPIQQWFTQQGIRAFILMYRCPADKQDPGTLQDIQQALRLVRAKAKEWHIDPDRVGFLGSSAGGHLCVRAAVNAGEDSEKPNFTILLYPAYLVNRTTGKLNPWIKIPKDIAPTLIFAARDDRRHFAGSPAYEAALKKAGAPVRAQYFSTGGHGFSLKTRGVEPWPATCVKWLREIKILRR